MRTFGKWILAMIVFAALAMPAVAATKAGDKELSAQISVSTISTDDFDVTLTSIWGAFGYFVSDALQVGGSLTTMTVSTDAADAGQSFIEGFVKYHFNTKEKAVPYVGAMLGTVTLYTDNESGSGVTFGAMAGVKYFMSEDLSVNGEYSIRHYTVTIAGTDISSTTSTAMIGLSYYFH